MKKILYLFLTVSLIFSSCKKEEDEVVTPTDIRDQLVGEYSGAATGILTNLNSMATENLVGLVTWRCEKSGSSNINLILPGFGGQVKI